MVDLQDSLVPVVFLRLKKGRFTRFTGPYKCF